MEKIVKFEGEELQALQRVVHLILADNMYSVEVWIDDKEGLKFKFDNGVWSPPYGVVEERP